MTDPTRLEPKDGDFVAYVEALQEESLEALRRANQAAVSHPLQVPDASAHGEDMSRIAAEMDRRGRAERLRKAQEHSAPAPEPGMLQRTKETVAESFRRMRRDAARAQAPSPARPKPKQPLAFAGAACIMIGFFLTFAVIAEGREDLAGPFVFIMIVGVLLGRIAQSRR